MSDITFNFTKYKLLSFVSDDGTEILYIRKKYAKYTHEDIEYMFSNAVIDMQCNLNKLSDFILEELEQRTTKKIEENTHKVLSSIAMKMLYYREDKSYISEITGLSLDELNILQ